jgi:hypothetical protein
VFHFLRLEGRGGEERRWCLREIKKNRE